MAGSASRTRRIGYVVGPTVFLLILLWPVPDEAFSSTIRALGVADPVPLVLAVTFSASMAFMLPVATPPNALVYGTGRIPMSAMVRNGFAMNLIGWAGVLVVVFLRH